MALSASVALLGRESLLPPVGIVSRSADLAFSVLRVLLCSLLASVKLRAWLYFEALLALLVRFGSIPFVMQEPVRDMRTDQFQIVDSVVEAVMVAMVNDLVRLQRATDVFLHRVSMLQDALAFDVQHFVASLVDAPALEEVMEGAAPSRNSASLGAVVLTASSRLKTALASTTHAHGTNVTYFAGEHVTGGVS